MSDMKRYLELTDEVRSLQQEYEMAAARLDPLRWKLIEAKAAADAAWKRIRGRMESALTNGVLRETDE